MPAGDLLPTSGETYAAELRAYLIADTEDWKIKGFKGLGDNKVKTRDTDIDGADGAVAAADYLEAFPIILTMRCRPTGPNAPSAGELAIVDLQDAWAPSTTDLELHLWVPGREHLKVTGRPRDLEIDRVNPAIGAVDAQAVFQVLDAVVEVVT